MKYAGNTNDRNHSSTSRSTASSPTVTAKIRPGRFPLRRTRSRHVASGGRELHDRDDHEDDADDSADRADDAENADGQVHEAWYDRVLEVVAIHQPASSVYVFAGPEDSVVDGMPGYVRVTREALDQWSVLPPATSAPSVPAAAPVSAPAPTAVAVASPAVAVAAAAAPAKPSVAKPSRKFRTVVRRHKVWHVYGTGRNARWVYVRRASR